jgi:CubicO group peptidase (beta-lactamase class C family)
MTAGFDFVHTQAREAGFCPERLARLMPIYGAAVQVAKLPGAVALIARRGRLVLHECIGMRDPVSLDAMALDSLFRIYSMTKPVVSVAVMMLVEQGRLLLSDPVAKFFPEFAHVQVQSHISGHAMLGKPRSAPTVHDLLRHTSGLTYETLGTEPVQRMYAQADLWSRDRTSREFIAAIAAMPLMIEPATTFAYSRATDVLGALVEQVSGVSLGDFLQANVLGPLQMNDTAFAVETLNHHRIAQPFAHCPDSGAPVQLIDVTKPYPFESGGLGLVSTALDYARFLQCLLQGGELGGRRLLSPNTVRFMTADHLGQMAQHFTQRSGYMLPPGVGFGLGFSVKLSDGMDSLPGSAGLYSWGGIAGTTFFVDPAKELLAILMTQAPNQRDLYRPIFRNMVYAALLE